MQVKESSILTYLRKIERAAAEIITPESYRPGNTTQADIHKRLLELPQTTQTFTCMEHNQLLEGHTLYMGTVAETMRRELVFLHLAVENFMQKKGLLTTHLDQIFSLSTLLPASITSNISLSTLLYIYT